MEGTVEAPTYQDAIHRLNSTQSGFKALEERRSKGVKLNSSSKEEMRQWIRRLGYKVSDLDRLNIVHVAGTKGKGTTCAFVNSILQRYQYTTGLPRKVGLYTSPHLAAVRERIRINSEPISEEQFTKYFFEVWDALESTAREEGIDPALKPSYFRYLTLMSFHIFMREGVDAAVYEVGVGGELDSTNVIKRPIVTGITTLGIDHVDALGDTIGKIAWHKAGIFKSGSPAFSVRQLPEATQVLEERAKEKEVSLTIIEDNPALAHVAIKPAEDFQRKNASLAIVLSQVLLDRLAVPTDHELGSLPRQFVEGLESVVWRGRCESKVTGKQLWHLDGAHTQESLEVACSWFGRVSQDRDIPCALVFNQQSTRDAVSLVKTIHHTIYDNFKLRFRYVVFCTNITYKGDLWKVGVQDLENRNVDPTTLKSLTLQNELAGVWHELDPDAEVAALPSIEDAIEYIRHIKGGAEEISVLVTGSFHLVGGALSVLEGDNFALANSTGE